MNILFDLAGTIKNLKPNKTIENSSFVIALFFILPVACVVNRKYFEGHNLLSSIFYQHFC